LQPIAKPAAAPERPPPPAAADKPAADVKKRDKSKKKMSDEEVLTRLREIVNPADPTGRFTDLRKIGQG